jgi:hypothetical protein
MRGLLAFVTPPIFKERRVSSLWRNPNRLRFARTIASLAAISMDDRPEKAMSKLLSPTRHQKKLLLAVWSYVGALSAVIAVAILLIFRSPSLLLPVLILFIGCGAIGTLLAFWDKKSAA